jgi:RNA polymerase sigma-70 factor, ECF subfamily
LPEPWLGAVPAADVESLAPAFLLLLEALSPLERAVFVLHDVFDFEHSAIGEILGRDVAACRQVLHRAREHVSARRPRFAASPGAHRTVLFEFMRLVSEGNLEGLVALFAADARLTTDGGGKVKAARKTILGADAVARAVLGLVKKLPPGSSMDVADVNGRPGMVLRVAGVVGWVVTLECDEHHVYSIQSVGNPDKLLV